MFNKINWKVRFMNRAWVIGFTGAMFVLITAIFQMFGVDINLQGIEQNIYNIIYAVFGVLAILGVVVDPTTPSIGDSENALSYTIPGINEHDFEDEEVEE